MNGWNSTDCLEEFAARNWFRVNVALIALRLPGCKVEHDADNGSWICIHDFPLPPNFAQATTTLIVVTEGFANAVADAPDGFWIGSDAVSLRNSAQQLQGESELRMPSGTSFVYFSLVIHRWDPSPDAINGDNLLHFVNTVYACLARL